MSIAAFRYAGAAIVFNLQIRDILLNFAGVKAPHRRGDCFTNSILPWTPTLYHAPLWAA